MIYLHIGRHKTGTTAIQHFLGANRGRLAKHNIVYPSTGTSWPEEAHHGVWVALGQRTGAVRQPLALPVLKPTDLERFARVLSAAPNAVVSSEAFQDLNPEQIVDVFPPGNTTVVVYLREQLDYFLSAYSQEIQSEIDLRSVEEFITDASVHTHYGPFLDSWADVFGRSNLIVKVYDRERLKHGDVVDDFMDTLGIDSIEEFVRPDHDPNVSLSTLLRTTKKLLNRVLTPAQHHDWDLYSRFRELAALTRAPRRLTVDQHAAHALRQRYRAENEDVSRSYLGSNEDVFRYVPVEVAAPATAPEVRAMLDRLDELAPGAHKLLIETVDNDELVTGLPPDERALAATIRGLRKREAPGSVLELPLADRPPITSRRPGGRPCRCLQR
jgi:hypothetical protein